MLTRLKVSGFKNLVDVDIRFGAFTCIAGVNGAGKSNLFDAIQFLSFLADRPLMEAALSVRDAATQSGNIRDLFHRVGDRYIDRMSLEAEVIIPAVGEDDLGQPAQASITFLRYSLTLGYRGETNHRALGPLEILQEELVHINRGEAAKHLPFPHSAGKWRKTAVVGARRAPFISTEQEGQERVISLHQDGGSSGRPLSRLATNLPRTVLSVSNAAESPTALLVKREMQSWRLLQLEPSALRKPDELMAPSQLATDGSHLPATLYRLASQPGVDAAAIYSRVANTLADLMEDVHSVQVDNDPKRELLTLQVTSRDRTVYPARSLSDGTLGFLALAVLKLDPETRGLICLEEPENGIHPARIPKMLQLLQEIAVDTQEAVGPDNPLRQVIVNTHSPVVVQEVPDDSLVVAELKEALRDEQRFQRVCFSYLDGTWRSQGSEGQPNLVSRGKLTAYLHPTAALELAAGHSAKPKSRRVRDRPDLQPFLPGLFEESP